MFVIDMGAVQRGDLQPILTVARELSTEATQSSELTHSKACRSKVTKPCSVTVYVARDVRQMKVTPRRALTQSAENVLTTMSPMNYYARAHSTSTGLHC